MPVNQHRIDRITTWVGIVAICSLFVSIHLSRALFTIGSVLLWAAWLVFAIRNKRLPSDRFSLFLIIITVIWLADSAFRSETDLGSLNIRFGFILTGLSLIGLKFDRHQKTVLFSTAALTMLVTSTLSVINYVLNRDEIDQLLLQSKHIPLFSEMHHIHFGVLLALSIVGVFWLIRNGILGQGVQKVLWVVMGILVLNIHVLSSRTGLTGFWVMAGVSGVYFFFTAKKNKKNAVIAALAAVSIALAGLLIVPSLNNKLKNTVEDVNATLKGGDDINHKSFGMRVEAWKNSLFLVSKNPVFGYGNGHQETAMQDAYLERNTILDPENRIGIHNQYLEFTVTNGLLLTIPFVLLLALIARERIKRQGILGLAVWSLAVWSMLFESMIERQHGVFIIAFLLFMEYDNAVDEATNSGTELS